MSKDDYEKFSKAIYRIETGVSLNEYSGMVSDLIDNVNLENEHSRRLLDMFKITGSAWDCKFSEERLARQYECMMLNFTKLKNVAPDIDESSELYSMYNDFRTKCYDVESKFKYNIEYENCIEEDAKFGYIGRATSDIIVGFFLVLEEEFSKIKK